MFKLLPILFIGLVLSSCGDDLPTRIVSETVVYENKNTDSDLNEMVEDVMNKVNEIVENDSEQSDWESEIKDESLTSNNTSKKTNEKILTFVECSCGAHDCGIIFSDEEGNNHEFYQNDISNYDFSCPSGTKYYNRKFRVNFETVSSGYEKLISISLLQ